MPSEECVELNSAPATVIFGLAIVLVFEMTKKFARLKLSGSVVGVTLTAILAIVIGCGGGGSSATYNPTSTTGLPTTTTTASTTPVVVATTGSAGPGALQSNAIYYGITDPVDPTATDIRVCKPDGTDLNSNNPVITIPSTVSAAAVNQNTTNQIIFAAQETAGAPYGIYSNSSLTLTGATTIISPSYTSVDSILITPDNKTIVFTIAANYPGSDFIYSVPITGGTVTKIDQGDNPSLSPSGQALVYSRTNSDTLPSNIYINSLDGLRPSRLTNTTDDDLFPQFDKQGKNIVFSRSTGSNSIQLYTMGIDGSNPTQITSDSDLTVEGGSYSPDGTQVAYPAHQSTAFPLRVCMSERPMEAAVPIL